MAEGCFLKKTKTFKHLARLDLINFPAKTSKILQKDL